MIRLRDMLLEEAHREITIQDKTRPLSMPVARAALRSLALNAAQGTVSAQKLFLESLNYAENEEVNEQYELFEKAVQYKERTHAEIEHAKKHNLPLNES